jgi:hypothetical protein
MYFCPKAVLEVGTHVVHRLLTALAALRHCGLYDHYNSKKLTMVDIRDVNDTRSPPWRTFGSKYFAKEMSENMGASNLVKFVVSSSVQDLSTCAERFDFILLKGNHSATTVYQEIPLALRLLNQGGVILLHDFFRDLKPL